MRAADGRICRNNVGGCDEESSDPEFQSQMKMNQLREIASTCCVTARGHACARRECVLLCAGAEVDLCHDAESCLEIMFGGPNGEQNLQKKSEMRQRVGKKTHLACLTRSRERGRERERERERESLKAKC